MKIVFFANTDWYLYNFRLGLARYLRGKGHELVMISPPGEYGPRFSGAGFRWIELPMNRRSLNPLREARLLIFIRNTLRHEKPELLHNFTIKSVIYGALAGRAAGISSRINSVTGLGHVFVSNSIRARGLRPLVKGLLRFALHGHDSHLVLQNPDDRELFERLGLVSTDHVHLVKGSGVDTERFVPVRRERGPRFRVLLASRLLWEKGIQAYVDAAKHLQDRYSEIEFLLAGANDPGNPSSIPNTALEEWEQEGVVEVLGHVGDMKELMRTVDLVVLPSHREGVPRGLIEAAAMALPIVTTDAPGCREIVADGVNGYLVPIDDAVALARRIEQLHDNPALCRAFGEAGRQRVLAEFDEQIVFEKTWAVYQLAHVGAG